MNKKFSVLHIIETIGVGGGAESLLANTVVNLPEYENVVVTLYPYYTQYDLGDIPIYCLNITSTWSLVKSIPHLRKIIRKHEVRLIHAHLFWSVLLAKLAKPRKVKLAVSLHNLLSIDLFKKSRLALSMERLLKSRQDAIIAVSKTVLDDYLQFVRFRKKTFVLYNFIPDVFFQQDIRGLKEGPIYCLSVGKLKEQKNYPYIIRSFRGWNAEDIQLDLYGEGEIEKDLQQIIREYQLKNVRIEGLSDKIHSLLRNYQVFISASFYEGFGIALVEAMAAGLVCVVSDIPVYREVAGDSCLFFDIDNPGALHELLEQIMDKKIDVSQLPAKARQRAFEIYRQENYLLHLKKIYEEVLE
jgi:glycosyltransferase involved in cell wall biosynthesis